MSRFKNMSGLMAACAVMIILVMMISVSSYAAGPAAGGVYQSDSLGSVLYFSAGTGSSAEQAASRDLAAAQEKEARAAAQSGIISLNGRNVRALGRFRLTGYCPCYLCSEGHGSMTATGVRAAAGRTVAVDPRVIPYGTHLLINGQEYVAEDCGGLVKGNHIDIYFNTHAEAQNFMTYAEVYVLQ